MARSVSKPMPTRVVRRAVRAQATQRRAPSAPVVAAAPVAALMAAPSAMAATEAVSQVALDGRLIALPLILAPAVGWVLFNILGPASRQIENMQKKK